MTGTRRTKKSADYHRKSGKIIGDAESYKSKQVGTLMVFVFFPLFALIALAISEIIKVPPILTDAEDAKEAMDNILKINKFLTAVQKEREIVSQWISSKGKEPSSWNHGDILKPLSDTDDAISNIYKWPKAVTGTVLHLKSKRTFQRQLTKFRQQAGKLNVTLKESNTFYMGIFDIFVIKSHHMVKLPERGQLWRNVASLTYLMRVETANRQRLSLIQKVLASCSRTRNDLLSYYKFNGEVQAMLGSASAIYKPVEQDYKKLYENSDLEERIASHEQMISDQQFSDKCQNTPEKVKSEKVKDFEDYIEVLRNIKYNLIEKTIDELDDIAKDSRIRIIIYVVLLIVVAILCLCFIVRHFRTIDDILNETISFAEKYTKKFQQISMEKQNSDQLLYEMVPRPIAEGMKTGQAIEATHCENVSICYIDIVGFVALISQYTPIRVIHLLQELYRMYDQVIETGGHNVYKMEQTNDVYCAASGIADNIPDHAAQVANFLIEILNRLDYFEIEAMPNVKVKVRAGAHTGACAAGVLGIKSPRYSIFGESVKMASRMSRLGDVQKIHISEQTKEALERSSDYIYNITPRGDIDVYGIGKVQTYYLERD